MKKTALVLAGGGALGTYEVGAYEALKELGYKFDIVTGTSIGALNGAYIASGQFEKAKQLWIEATPELIMKDGINIAFSTLKKLTVSNYSSLLKAGKSFVKNRFSMDNSPFKDYVKNTLDVDALLKSETKLGVVTTRLPAFAGEEVIVQDLSPELVIPYLHASSACVPVFPVETIEGRKYIDGVYHDNLPITFAFNMGAREVIAIDLRLFSMNPLNSYFLKLPDVIYIGPYISLGSMMDFDHDKIMRNMELGRLDVLKHFKVLRGYTYAFKEEINKNNIGFIRRVVKKFGNRSKQIFKELEKDIRTPMMDVDYFYRTIEIMLKRMKYTNYYQVVTLKEIQQIFKDYIYDQNGNIINSKKKTLFKHYKPLLRKFYSFIFEHFMEREYE